MRHPRDPARTPLARHGHTLLELILATSLVAIALVPGLRLMRDGLSLSRGIETRSLLTTLCVSKLEENLALSAASWTTGATTGNFSAEGYAGVRFQVNRSDDGADGGITDRLMAVNVTVWEDEDSDTTLDADELQVTFRSKIAKITTYENEASGP